MNRLLFIDPQGVRHEVTLDRRLPGRMWICHRVADGRELFIHEDDLKPIKET